MPFLPFALSIFAAAFMFISFSAAGDDSRIVKAVKRQLASASSANELEKKVGIAADLSSERTDDRKKIKFARIAVYSDIHETDHLKIQLHEMKQFAIWIRPTIEQDIRFVGAYWDAAGKKHLVFGYFVPR
jgi:hypothetical protein